MNSSKANCSVYIQLYYDRKLTYYEVPALCDVPPRYPLLLNLVIVGSLGFLTLGTLFGNILVVTAVGLVKKLHTPSNILIVSLAFSDLFVSVLVLPLASIAQVYGYWPFNERVCDTFLIFDVLFCTSSILNLCAISIDRYLVITQPLFYVAKRTPRLMIGMTVVVWLVSALISIPPSMGWKGPFVAGVCAYSDSLAYQIYATSLAFYLPLFIMIVLYLRIYKLARHMARADAKHLPPSAHLSAARASSSQRTSSGETKYLSVPGTLQSESSRRTSRDSAESANGAANDGSDGCGIIGAGGSNAASHEQQQQQATSLNVPLAAPAPERRISRVILKTLTRRSDKKASESKAVKTLGVIMGCFTVCWLPFFAIQLLIPIFRVVHVTVNIPSELIDFFLWLGYLNSFCNPIIYAKFNRDYRTPFREIVLCRCAEINTRLRCENYAEQCGMTYDNAASSRRASCVSRRGSCAVQQQQIRRNSSIDGPASLHGNLNRLNSNTTNNNNHSSHRHPPLPRRTHCSTSATTTVVITVLSEDDDGCNEMQAAAPAPSLAPSLPSQSVYLDDVAENSVVTDSHSNGNTP